ncbi:MAG TPA: cob(I)yrinic acid a,c-diamide adenosyltransferase [Candidatus Avacidaminococcus intestinavium]|uniref:Cob(I)yrinic acid a,c-diamide adenosyltransferase n=1 Tax=Candidatus Avacidaminococcus intestinavium TaxID=2840684 RepID=A0A9D1SKQ4_9FIRM|nr:cob(I)yrinic acid a,c-diamide adenosyltransferase [Candidatus Avacidaminococcus intestinavium]
MKDYGKLQVYTGTGKGKTTAALGVILRASGYGAKSLMVQFMKDDQNYGEYRAFNYIPNFTLKQFGRDSFVNFKDPDPIDLKMMQDGWLYAKNAILTQEYDIIVLDEINILLAYELLPSVEIIDFLESARGNTEIITTGRYAPETLLNAADLVTDMNAVKHYFFAGTKSRDGIDH